MWHSYLQGIAIEPNSDSTKMQPFVTFIPVSLDILRRNNREIGFSEVGRDKFYKNFRRFIHRFVFGSFERNNTFMEEIKVFSS